MAMTTGGPPPPGITWQALIFDSFTLAADTEIRMKNIPDAQFNMAVKPSFQMRPPSKFRLRVAPMIEMAGGNNEFAQFGMSVNPRIRWIPSAAFKASVTPMIAMGGKPKSAGLFGVNVTPHLGMVGKNVVNFDAKGTGASGTGTAITVSQTHTIAGNAVVMPVCIQSSLSTTQVTAKVGTTAMTKLGVSPQMTNAGFFYWIVWFGLLNPPTGSQTITATADSGTNYCSAISLSYNSVASFGSITSGSGTTSVPALSVPSAKGQMVAEAYATWNTNPSGYTQTSRYAVNVNNPARPFQAGDAPGAATVNFSAVTSDQWTAAAVPLIPAP